VSALNAQSEVLEEVIRLMNETGPFAKVTRGALPTGHGLTCEIAPSRVSNTFLDKETLIPLDVTLNGKHRSLKVVTDAMNRIHLRLTRARTYPAGIGWQIVDIRNGMLPEIIGREQNNDWLLASSLTVLYHWKGE
jgi:hypothetical protein